jgi:two-component system LytT family response regulator
MPDKIRVVIVDDEELARERIASLLSRESGIEIVGAAGDGRSAVKLIEERRPHLVFLDVQMPEMNGFDVLRNLSVPTPPSVIFVTAHDRFAVRAFEVHAVDYLLKPFDRERFSAALNRAIAGMEARKNPGPQLNSLLAALKTAKPLDRLLVKCDGRVLVIKTADLDWIEAADNYVNLHLANETRLMRETMNSLESKLSPETFLRISRSIIVNLERIKELQPMFHGEYVVVLKNGTKLTLTRNYRDKLDRLMGGA